MTINIEKHPVAKRHIWRIIGWGTAVGLILTPLVAMQFTNEVNWDETDFLFAAVIFGIVGGIVEIAMRVSSNWYFRTGAMFAVFAGFVLVWANAAIGMIGNEDNAANLWFGLVILVAAFGTLRLRFIAAGMFAAGTLQLAIGLVAGVFGTDPRGGIFTIMLSSLWYIASLLLRVGTRVHTH